MSHASIGEAGSPQPQGISRFDGLLAVISLGVPALGDLLTTASPLVKAAIIGSAVLTGSKLVYDLDHTDHGAKLDIPLHELDLSGTL
jgi:hypothetical protein